MCSSPSKTCRWIKRATSGHGPFRRQRMESVRLHHVVGLLQLPTCRHLHHQQCRRQEIHRHIHRGQRTQRLLAAHGRSRIQRDIRQQRKLRLVLLQQRHHVGHLLLTHLRRSHLHGNRHHANGSHRQTDRQNRRGPPSASQKPKMCPTA